MTEFRFASNSFWLSNMSCLLQSNWYFYFVCEKDDRAAIENGPSIDAAHFSFAYINWVFKKAQKRHLNQCHLRASAVHLFPVDFGSSYANGCPCNVRELRIDTGRNGLRARNMDNFKTRHNVNNELSRTGTRTVKRTLNVFRSSGICFHLWKDWRSCANAVQLSNALKYKR